MTRFLDPDHDITSEPSLDDLITHGSGKEFDLGEG